MKVLIKQANIVCPTSPHHGKISDILITEGIIEKIAPHIDADAPELIDYEGLHVSVGWMDIFANFNDPGQEQKETLETGSAAAVAGGFTDLMLMPNTHPAVCSKSAVEYLKQKGKALPVNIHPIGAVSKNLEGKDLAEMYDMAKSGAIAFGDGTASIQHPGILLKALQYVLAINATVIQLPDDQRISANGLMNEGIISTQLGLPGKPAIAEEMMIARDIELLRYTGSRLHITGVSTQKGIQLISAAKAEGLQITCSATPYHGWFNDADLVEYDSNLKVNPPLRKASDQQAICAALLDGSIDCFASHHLPQHWDNKTCEFEYAANGMIGLETLFGVVNSYGIGLEKLIGMLTDVPRKIFGLATPAIEEGAVACLTLFNPFREYIFGEEMIRSKSKNTAFNGKMLKGKVIGIVNKNKISINK